MTFDYRKLKTAPKDMSIIILFKFLANIKNASLRPDTEKEDDCPPILFWWFEEENEEINKFIQTAVANFPWKNEWIIETVGNNKWLLFPKRLREAEKILKGSNDDNLRITTNSAFWLMKNDPEFGRRANLDLYKFKKYFRSLIEDYLKNKEQKN